MFTKLKDLKSRKPDQGFTIIEVMIVLAIAGLILLIVFLAVPALQRSARNTQRKNDAAAVGSAIANFIANNGGVPPTGVLSDGTNTNNILFGSAANTNTETAKLGYYTVTASDTTVGGTDGSIVLNTVATNTPVTPAVGAPSSTPSSINVTQQSLVIEVGENCDSTNTQAGIYNARTAAIFYVTESGTGNGSRECVEQ